MTRPVPALALYAASELTGYRLAADELAVIRVRERALADRLAREREEGQPSPGASR